MPEALRITLIVIGAIVGTWVLLLITNLIFVGSYLTIFKKHKKAMVVVLFTKLENLKKIFSVIRQSGVDIDPKLVEKLNSISEKDFEEPGSAQYINANNTLSYLKDEVMFVANEHSDLVSSNEFNQAKKNVVEADALYRNNVTMYNADVLGYNYWIRFLPCRFVFKIFRKAALIYRNQFAFDSFFVNGRIDDHCVRTRITGKAVNLVRRIR